MTKLNPIERSEYIRGRYASYLRSSFHFNNPEIQNFYHTEVDELTLFKGPFLDLSLPFKRGKNINELINDGVISKSFLKLGSIDFNRPLYLHQEESLKKIASGRGAIITTGTGSGKTESFLFPIINEILKDLENGVDDSGVRAVFLYPMNALLNDQIKRVREILTTFPDITFGFYTGETKPSCTKKERANSPSNEMISREEIRSNPPHLLFTNYSMLEYLLIRPNDSTIFSPGKLENWKYVVLDEAHTYYGSLGIEISLLMRRLTGLVSERPRFILTSATLGKQGESEEDIMSFANNLTSSGFVMDDIIFAKRIPFDSLSCKYSVNGSDYIVLKSALHNVAVVEEICKKYISIESDNVQEYLYNLLIHDKNVGTLYSLLGETSKNFNDVCVEFKGELVDKELVSLIDLINIASYRGIGIFDLKYHSFVRPISGAYMSFGEKSQLTLTKTNYISGLKAFEIGNCKFCRSAYIFGRIWNNPDNNLHYLLQNDEIDIYENYGDNKHTKIEYFVLDEGEIDDKESNRTEKCTLCSKCGAISAVDNLNAKKCDCGSEFEFIVHRVTNNDDKQGKNLYNNLKECPCCNKYSNYGVVKSLNLGKDEGTALVSQFLLESMQESEVVPVRKKISLKKQSPEPTIKPINVKQFLSFSDSRQQASFSAIFMQDNHNKMLRKRLIWEVIKNENYQTITVDRLAASLTKIIENKNLFDNNLGCDKNAWIALLYDLLKVDGVFDGEGLGLYHFDLDVLDLIEEIDEGDFQTCFSDYGLTREDLIVMIQVVLSLFKTTPAVEYSTSTLTSEDKKEYLGYRRFDNSVMLKLEKSKKNVKGLLPINNKENGIIKYVSRVCGCDKNKAEEIIGIIFNSIGAEGEILTPIDRQPGEYRIDVSKYVIKNYKNTKYFKCKKCGTITPYNVKNICPKPRCDGDLIEIDPDEELKLNFYRNQYMNKTIERIVYKEHTAQLENSIARKYQKDFVDGKINVLSCSTTFEMGIDIGNLETVLLRNIPPTPANYVQRAGRAGRRMESSAYVLTYCGSGSHDYTYFQNPERMIRGVITPPVFEVSNKKIITRHLMSTCLGFFFRKNESYFKSVEELVFKGGIEMFTNYMNTYPEDLNKYISEKVFPEKDYQTYHNYTWYKNMGGEDEKLKNFGEMIKSMVLEFEEAKDQAKLNEIGKDLDYYKNQICKIYNMKVIDALSRYCVIPKYGFPVDVVDLEVFDKNGNKQKDYDLSRDLRIAISEYAPDSEIVVDGNKYTSKYISLVKGKELNKNYLTICSNCGKSNIHLTNLSSNKCKYCNEPINLSNTMCFMEPVYGFKTGETIESTRKKPKKSYAGEVSYIGGGLRYQKTEIIDGKITIETNVNDELVVLNRSDFYYCPVCGYAEILQKGVYFDEKNMEHKNHKKFPCSNTKLRRIKLGHSFQTDVSRVTIPKLSYSNHDSKVVALSFLYAFLEGISKALNIERKDIDGIIEKNLELNSYDILIYDNVPGGAGHSKRLLNETSFYESLYASYEKVSQECCDGDTSCYSCLRNYYNQAYHNLLNRSKAKEFLTDLLGDKDSK